MNLVKSGCSKKNLAETVYYLIIFILDDFDPNIENINKIKA